MTRTRRPQPQQAQTDQGALERPAPDAQSQLGNAAIQDSLRLAQTADGRPIRDGDVLIPAMVRGESEPATQQVGAPAPRNASQTNAGGANPDFVGEAQPPHNPYERTVTNHNIPLFDEHGPGYQDPLQGGLGDCYLIASLSAVAQQDPGRIRRMIRPMSDGRYVVTFWVARTENGIRTFNPHDEIVDNAVPSSNLANVPDYGGTGPAPDPLGLGGPLSQRELWVSLVERAYAQWRGGYNLAGEGANAALALEELTGLESQVLYPQREDPERVIEAVERALRAHSAVVASTGPNAQVAAAHGLVEAHGYSVLSAGSGRLLLRNPQRDPQVGGRRASLDADAVRACLVEIAINPVAGAMTRRA